MVNVFVLPKTFIPKINNIKLLRISVIIQTNIFLWDSFLLHKKNWHIDHLWPWFHYLKYRIYTNRETDFSLYLDKGAIWKSLDFFIASLRFAIFAYHLLYLPITHSLKKYSYLLCAIIGHAMKIFQMSKFSLCLQGAHNLNASQNPSESPAWLVKTVCKTPSLEFLMQ